MTELEKCMAGEWYDCHDKVFLEFKNKTHRLLMKYNSLPYDHKEEKRQVLQEMLGSIGAKVSIGHSFICDYGRNIHIGNNVTVNTGCTFVDCNRITIGNNVLIAPNVQIYTATHPFELDERLTHVETAEGVEYVRHTYELPETAAGMAAASLSCPALPSEKEASSEPAAWSPKIFLPTVWRRGTPARLFVKSTEVGNNDQADRF